MELSQIHNYLSEQATKLGITHWDLAGSKSISCSVSINSGKIDKIQSQDSIGYGMRVFGSQTFGYIHSSDLSFKGLSNSLHLAKELADLKLGDTAPQPNEMSLLPINLPDKPILTHATDPGMLTKRLLDVEKEVLNSSPYFKQISYNGIGEASGEKFYLNSLGATRHNFFSHAWLFLYLLAEKKSGSPRKAMVHTSANKFEELDIDRCVSDMIQKGQFVLDPVQAAQGKLRICFHPEAFLTLLQCFSNIWSGRRILDGKSLSKKETVGQIIAAKQLTIIDDPMHRSNEQPEWFDDEGLPTKPLTLIDQGVLAHVLHNEETARLFHQTPTGHAVMGPRSGVSHHYLTVAEGTTNKDWKKEPATLYVEKLNSLHAGIQDLQGSFSLPVDGQISIAGENKSFDSAVISGDILKCLQNISHVDQTALKTDRGFAPEVWIEDISVTAGL